MKQFTIMPHTADVAIQLTATTKEELYELGVEVIAFFLEGEHEKKEATVETIFDVTSSNETLLFFDFLNEVLTESHIRHAVFTHVRVAFHSPLHLTATVIGHKTIAFQKDVKAVTYHNAFLAHSKEFFQTTVVLDI